MPIPNAITSSIRLPLGTGKIRSKFAIIAKAAAAISAAIVASENLHVTGSERERKRDAYLVSIPIPRLRCHCRSGATVAFAGPLSVAKLTIDINWKKSS